MADVAMLNERTRAARQRLDPLFEAIAQVIVGQRAMVERLMVGLLTGGHGIHLLGGMAALCYLLLRASLRPESVLFDFRRQRTRAAVSALYWHFLSVLWLALFLGLLLWP